MSILFSTGKKEERYMRDSSCRFFLGIVVFLSALFLCGDRLEAQEGKAKVGLQLFWKHQFEFAGFYAALEKGYYREAGLDVDIVEYQAGMDVNEEVLSGRADFGTVSSCGLLDYLNGRPVTLLANFFKHSALVILSARDAHIRLPKDLEGKRLMLTAQEKTAIELLSFFKKNGIAADKLQIIEHTFDPTALRDGKTDAMSAYLTNQPFVLREMGVEFTVLDPTTYGISFYGDSLFTSATLAKKNPQLVQEFTDASIKGWLYALENPQEIIDLILQKYNSQNKSRAALEFEAREMRKLILPETYAVGSIDPGKIRQAAESMKELGLVKDLRDLDGFFFKTLPSDRKDTDKEEAVSGDNDVSMVRHVLLFALAFLIIVTALPALLKKMRPQIFERLLESNQVNLVRIVVLSVAFFLGAVMHIAVHALRQMDNNLRQELGANLVAVNNSVEQSLHIWQEHIFHTLHHLTGEYGVLETVQEQLAVPRNTTALLAGESLQRLRELYREQMKGLSNVHGFCIIAPDRITVASINDYNIGKVSLIAQQHPDILDRAFSGDMVFVPPAYTEVSSPHQPDISKKKTATMFIATPVKDSTGQIIAVLTLQLDPAAYFYNISRIGRIGNTGESYAFDQKGRLLTPARFVAQLTTLPDLGSDFAEWQDFYIRDPGGNLLENYQPETNHTDWPLTKMAQEALAGHKGFNIDGYRDCRGAPVMGAWFWSEELGIGLATEIDMAEALAPYHRMRFLVLCSLFGTAFIAVMITASSVWLGQRVRGRLEDLVEARTTELQEAEYTRNLALEAAQIGLWSRNLQDNTCSWDSRVKSIMGIPEEVTPDLGIWFKAIHPDDRDYVVQTLQTATQGDEAYLIEYRMVLPNEEIVYVSHRGKMSRDKDGVPLRVDGVLNDVSQLRRAEAAIQKEQERSELILNSVGEGIFGLDRFGKVTFCNEAAARMLGYGREALIGCPMHETVHYAGENGEPYPGHTCPMYRSFTEGTTEKVADEFLWRKDGSCFPVEYTATPISSDKQLVGAVIVFRDISSRKAAEEALTKLSQAVEQSPVVVIITDKNGIIEYVNPRFSEVTGFSAEEAIGQNPRILKSEKTPASLHAELWATISSGRIWKGEMIDKIKSGEEIWESVSISPISNTEGRITHYVAVKEDITEKKAVEAEIKASGERFKVLFEKAADAYLILDGEQFVNCNQAAVDMLQYKNKNELLALSPVIISPEFQPDGERSEEKATRMIATAYAQGGHRFDWQHITKSGEEIPLEVTLTPIDLDGRHVLLAVWHDMAERNKFEAELEASRRQVQHILDTSPVGVAFSTKGVIHFTNPRFTEMFDAKPGDTSPQLYVHPEEREELVARLSAGGMVENCEIQMYGKNQQIRDIMITYLSYSYEGEEGILSWMMDITERKQMEQEVVIAKDKAEQNAQQLQEKLEQLRRFRRMASGRELKMIELKKEINKLLGQYGQEEKYTIVSAEKNNVEGA